MVTSPQIDAGATRQISGPFGTVCDSTADWPCVDEGALQGAIQTQYVSRVRAVRLYFSGASHTQIHAECGLGLKQVYRLIRERCLVPHADGRIHGWRGLIPYLRIKPYERVKPVASTLTAGRGSAAGALQNLLNIHPDLRRRLDSRILSTVKPGSLGPVRRSRLDHWRWFIKELQQLGLEMRGEWPFNTRDRAYSSLCRYMDHVLASHPERAVQVGGGENLKRKMASGDGVDRPVHRVFQRVEMDAHKLDGRFCVAIPQVTGGETDKIIHRLWVLVIVEVESRVVLGYHLSMNLEVTKEDVLRTLKKALTPTPKRQLVFLQDKLREGAGMPPDLGDEYIGLCWDETSVDGALAETCKRVETELREVVGSVLLHPKNSFSVRRSLDDRPFIEQFFKNLGQRGFQKLSNSTGNHPRARQGRDIDKIALASRFQLEYAEEILYGLIANYNAKPHSSLGHRSPLDYLRFRLSSKKAPVRQADPHRVQSMLSFRKRCMVKGGYKEGRAPYVNFEGARYSNETLAQRHDLVGSSIWVVNHFEDDARVAQASTLNGMPLGVLRAAPPWHRLPHSLAVRRAINSFARRHLFEIPASADATEAFLGFVESQPGRKLKPHPAYLEVRRILAQDGQNPVGERALAAALAKQAAALDDAGEVRQTPESERTAEATGGKRSLPPPRMTATK